MFFPTISTSLALLIILVALVGIALSSGYAVENAKVVARTFGLSEAVIGLTIVSIGTSLPEIFVNIASGQSGDSTVGIGNIIGSCLGQITLIMGICMMIGGPAKVNTKLLKRDGVMLFVSIALLVLLGSDGNFTHGEGILLSGVYISYIIYVLRKKESCLLAENKESIGRTILHCISLFVMLAIVYLTADLIVQYGVMIGRRLSIDEELIGIAAGVGTSMPELAVSITALLHKSSGIGIGNLIGSNITDPLFSLGFSAAMYSYTFTIDGFYVPIIAWIVGTIVALICLFSHKRMTRFEGFILFCVFVVYLMFEL